MGRDDEGASAVISTGSRGGGGAGAGGHSFDGEWTPSTSLTVRDKGNARQSV